MATQQIPQIPPRPTRSQAQKLATASGSNALNNEIPKIPPRPTNRRIDRSASPLRNPNAPTHLNEQDSVAGDRHPAHKSDLGRVLALDATRRPSSVTNTPSAGQEGIEYEGLVAFNSGDSPRLPNKTRNIAEDLELYAPRASYSGSNTQEQISTVTRTDSSQAAAFGFGRAGSEDRVSADDESPNSRPLKERDDFASIISERPQSAADIEDHSQEPDTVEPTCPDSHMIQPFVQEHEIMSNGEFEQSYNEEHPELWEKESSAYGEENNDRAISSEGLNEIVKQTGHKGSELGDTFPAQAGTTTESAGYISSDESTSPAGSPKLTSDATSASRKESSISTDKGDSTDSCGLPNDPKTSLENEHGKETVSDVEEPDRQIGVNAGAIHAGSTETPAPLSNDMPSVDGFITESSYGVPILGSDEVPKGPSEYQLQPAISPLQDNSDTAPQNVVDKEARVSPLEDVTKYEHIVQEGENNQELSPSPETELDNLHSRAELEIQQLPSQDVSEDTLDSHIQTTGAIRSQEEKLESGIPLGHEMSPAITSKAAAPKPFIPPRPAKKLSDPKPDVKAEADTTDAIKLANISPVLKAKPSIPERSKPVIPARPVKRISRDSGNGAPLSTVTSGGSGKSNDSDRSQTDTITASRPKPPVPSRPVGSKIAALQGGFLSDLNKRLQLGPQAPKKEEPKPEEVVEVKEKAPLVDARKGRARGPPRRAPVRAEVKAKDTLTKDTPVKKLTFLVTSTVWEINPEDGDLKFGSECVKTKKAVDMKVETAEPEKDKVSEEVLPTTTAIGAAQLTTEEVVAKTAANASKEVKDMVGNGDNHETEVEAREQFRVDDGKDGGAEAETRNFGEEKEAEAEAKNLGSGNEADAEIKNLASENEVDAEVKNSREDGEAASEVTNTSEGKEAESEIKTHTGDEAAPLAPTKHSDGECEDNSEDRRELEEKELGPIEKAIERKEE